MTNNSDLINKFLNKNSNVEPEKQKCLVVAFGGLPNAGKSSLANAIVGEKISIISPKVQTTRDIIRGVVVENETQLVIIDTPGLFIPKKDRLLERKIVRNAWNGIREADVVCIIIDSTRGISEKVKTIIADIKKKQNEFIFVLNKVDLVEKIKLLGLAKELNDLYPDYKQLFMVSATGGDNLSKLKNYLIDIAPQRPWLFDADELTDAPMKFMAAEITREKLFLGLTEDLPYSVDVVTENWEDFANGDIKIQQVIRVLKDSQKAIVIGKGGSMLKKINIEAREEMEKFFERRIHLYIFVQVEGEWIRKKE
ncbi:MAG: GTPase Era [Rickettsiales bacterium]|jgi:GTP-binding protein Era|nr:GTPase Era [Rickettsiales bacterium]